MLKYTTEEYVTKGGAKALLINIPDVPDVWIEAGFRAGHQYAIDFECKQQTAHIIEHMINNAGNDLFDREQMKWENDRNGTYNNAATRTNYSW